MIDDRNGLYSHASEAVEAGRAMGRQEIYLAIRRVLDTLSVKYEPRDDPTGFHVAEEAQRMVREVMEQFEKPRSAV